MKNFKVKVGNEAESKGVQDLFGEFGLNINDWSEFPFPKYISNFIDGEFSDYSIYDSGLNDCKEITLPELRDMVVLKRNDLGDATHENNHGQKLYKAQKGWHIYGSGSWLWNEESLGYTPIPLKPIEKKEMKAKEYLKKIGNKEYMLMDGAGYSGQDNWIEVPKGAHSFRANLKFYNEDGSKFYSVDNYWKESKGSDGYGFLWQRETLNDRVESDKEFKSKLPESTFKDFKQPEGLPFLDNGVDIGVENLPEFKPFNNGPVKHDSTAFTNLGIEYPIKNEIKTDFSLNRGDINCRAAIAFNAIRGTDLTEDDVHFLRELLNSITNHYGA